MVKRILQITTTKVENIQLFWINHAQIPHEITMLLINDPKESLSNPTEIKMTIDFWLYDVRVSHNFPWFDPGHLHNPSSNKVQTRICTSMYYSGQKINNFISHSTTCKRSLPCKLFSKYFIYKLVRSLPCKLFFPNISFI
jgi:hypothetical protein